MQNGPNRGRPLGHFIVSLIGPKRTLPANGFLEGKLAISTIAKGLYHRDGMIWDLYSNTFGDAPTQWSTTAKLVAPATFGLVRSRSYKVCLELPSGFLVGPLQTQTYAKAEHKNLRKKDRGRL